MSDELETLGSYLRRERKKRDVSIEQIAYATRISLKMLTALEEDHHQMLPAQPFVRGYLQAYAKYVQLDPKDVLLRYQHHLATQPAHPNWSVRGGFEDHESSGNERRRLVWITAGLIVLLLGSGSYVWLKKKLQEENARTMNRAPVLKNASVTKSDATPVEAKEPTVPIEAAGKLDIANAKSSDPLADLPKPPVALKTVASIKPPETKALETKPAEKEPAAVAATPKPEEKAKPEAAAAAATAANAPEPEIDNTPKKYNLALRAKEDVWLRFQTDSDEVKDLILRKDKVITIRAQKVIKLFSGNVRAMSGSLNGQPMDTLTQGDWKRSVVLPFSEIPNVKLPLFPGSGEVSSESSRPAPKKEAKSDAKPND